MPQQALEQHDPDTILAAFAKRCGINHGHWKLTVKFDGGLPRARWLEAGPMRGDEYNELTELLHVYGEARDLAAVRDAGTAASASEGSG
jgi:hypothetical protein